MWGVLLSGGVTIHRQAWESYSGTQEAEHPCPLALHSINFFEMPKLRAGAQNQASSFLSESYMRQAEPGHVLLGVCSLCVLGNPEEGAMLLPLPQGEGLSEAGVAGLRAITVTLWCTQGAWGLESISLRPPRVASAAQW